jgi:hypothetical protein
MVQALMMTILAKMMMVQTLMMTIRAKMMIKMMVTT